MEKKPLPEDFKEFIHLLNKNDVEYLLVGGWAVGLYGNPRATKDIDFLIAVDDENLEKLEKALYEFGAPTIDMSHFKEPGKRHGGFELFQFTILNVDLVFAEDC